MERRKSCRKHQERLQDGGTRHGQVCAEALASNRGKASLLRYHKKALAPLTFKEQSEAWTNNTTQTYDDELKARVVAQRKRGNTGVFALQHEIMIAEVGAESEGMQCYLEDIQARSEAKANKRFADAKVPVAASKEGAGQPKPEKYHEKRGWKSHADQLRAEHNFLDVAKCLLNNARSDIEVAKLFNVMRISMDIDPSLANCDPMGETGLRWGNALAWVARAYCLPGVVCLVDRRADTRKKLKNDDFAFTPAKHKHHCKNLLYALMTVDTIPQEYIAKAVDQQDVRYGDMRGTFFPGQKPMR